MKRILITGATGQIGSELTVALRKYYGNKNVIALGYNKKPEKGLLGDGPFHIADCRNLKKISSLIKKYKIDTIFHLAAILSAVAEDSPLLAWDTNINGLFTILELAREYKCAVFTPSSIGAFGETTPRFNTPQDTIQHPNTMYGITKVTGELLCDYYHTKFGVDTRGVRYPGIISYKTLPGGGTTDYAVEIFYDALKNKTYTCYLRGNTKLDMMYMPDAIKAAITLMEADSSKLSHRNAYNITAVSITPENLASEIEKQIPGFTINYNIDTTKQKIADSWPAHLDDSIARNDWNWSPDYDLSKMTTDMLDKLKIKLNINN